MTGAALSPAGSTLPAGSVIGEPDGRTEADRRAPRLVYVESGMKTHDLLMVLLVKTHGPPRAHCQHRPSSAYSRCFFDLEVSENRPKANTEVLSVTGRRRADKGRSGVAR